MDKELFKEIGLTDAEVKVYLALLKIGQTTAGPIIKKTGLRNSTLHQTLPSLVSKGFASFIIKGKTHYYTAADPKTVLKFIQEKEKRFQNMLPELEQFQAPIDKQEAEVYEGFKGFKNMLQEFIKDAEKGEEYLIFAFNNEEYNEKVYTYYVKEYQKEREKKGIIVKAIAPASEKKLFKRLGTGKIPLKYVNFPVPFNLSIFRDKIIMTPWKNKQISFMIHSQQLAEEYREFFYSIWKKN